MAEKSTFAITRHAESQKSEDQLQRQLNLARAICLSTDDTEAACVINLAARRAELGTIESIEELGAELDVPFSLAEIVILEEREIEILRSVRPQIRHNAGSIAESESRRNRKGGGVEPFRQFLLCGAVEVGIPPVPGGTLRAAEQEEVVGPLTDDYRQPALEGHNAVELPAAQRPIGRRMQVLAELPALAEGQVPNEARHKAMRDVLCADGAIRPAVIDVLLGVATIR